MTRDETIALWKKCEEGRAAALAQGKPKQEAHEEAKASWNAWAVPLRERRDELLRLGQLNLSSVQPRGFIASPKRALNPEAESFRSAAKADFCGHKFSAPADFSGFVFPGEALFGEFEYWTDHQPSEFSDYTRFDFCTFCDDVRFVSVRFVGHTGFRGALFVSDANFAGAEFHQSVSFSNTNFQGEVWFGATNFHNYSNFMGTMFVKDASFRGIIASGIFDLTEVVFTNSIPDFYQANFKEAPDLDNAVFLLPKFWPKERRLIIGRYRALRRLAIQGHDHENESKAFKGEMRARRLTVDKPWHAAFWFGVLYDALSDFGRSIARPMAVWCASWLAFAAIYFWNAGVAVSDWGAACANDGASKALKALTLSAANSLPLIGSSRGEVAAKFYKCLALPDEPAWSPILQISQTLWSTVLIFLFLLALRNQFKVK